MTRRQGLAALVGMGTAAASSYAWMERRGLIRSDFVSEEPTVAPRSAALEPAVRSILEFATLAPSGHNAQPWRVKASALATGVDLRIGSDRSRWLAKVDPVNRELALSIGAFLENLLIAAPPHGYLAKYSVTGSDAGDEELVRVNLKPATPQPGSLARLRARRTLRSGQQPRPLSSADAKSLIDHFDHRAHFFSPTSREGRYLAKGTIEANRAQAFRDDAQEELAAWIRLPNSQARAHRDGLTQESMEIAGFAGWYVRHFMSRATVLSQRFREQGLDRVKQQVASCGGWIVVTSPDGSLPSLIEAGRRTERMWLAVRDRSIAVHPMTQMLEESPFRDRLAQYLGITGPIQFLLRVGYVYQYPEAVSLRRPVSAILKA